MAWDPYPPKETNNNDNHMETIVAVLETMRDECEKQRDVLIKQVDDCTLPLNRASLAVTTAINQRALALSDIGIVLTNTIAALNFSMTKANDDVVKERGVEWR